MGVQEMKDLKSLRREEEKTVPGARVRTPRQQLVDARTVQAKHPDKHIRWVNIKDPQKVEERKNDGYVRLTSEEGGKSIGDQLALFAIPKEHASQRRREHAERAEMLLNAHKHEVRAAAEAAAKNLRDTTGIKVSANRLIIDESE